MCCSIQYESTLTHKKDNSGRGIRGSGHELVRLLSPILSWHIYELCFLAASILRLKQANHFCHCIMMVYLTTYMGLVRNRLY